MELLLQIRYEENNHEKLNVSKHINANLRLLLFRLNLINFTFHKK